MFTARRRNGEIREIGLAEMVERQSRLASLIAIAKRGMADLIRSISGGALVFLADPDGYILHAEGLRAGMFIGRNFLVDHNKCCDLSTVLAGRKPQLLSCNRECSYRSADQRMVIAPVYDGQHLAGVLGLSLDESQFSPVIIEFTRYFVDSISRELAINRAYSRLATASNCLTVLADLAYSMHAGKMTEQAVLQQVVEKLAKIAGSKSSLIAVVDKQGESLIPIAVYGHRLVDVEVTPLSKPDCSLVAALLSQKTLLTVRQQPDAENCLSLHVITTPVLVKGKVKGVITASSEREEPFDQETVTMFEIASGLVGSILENLTLHDKAKKERVRLIQLLENVNEAIALVNVNGVIVRCNATFNQWFSSFGDVVGVALADLNDGIGVDLGLIHERAIQELASSDLEFVFEQKYFHLRMEPSLIGSTLDGVIIIITDISEARHFEKVKAEILATISHELRTPVTAIQGYVDLFEIMPTSLVLKEQPKLLKSLKNEVKVLAAMVEKIVAFNHFQLNKNKLHTESLHLADIIETCIDSLKDLAENRSVSVSFYPSAPDIHISGYAWGIRGVIFDLLDNAIKFSKVGGEVAVGLDIQGSGAMIEIVDSGGGILPEERERIFEQFYRGEAAESGIPGSGLGLYVSRHIIREFGGNITIQDAEKGGTRFTVTLPLGKE